MRPVQRKQLSFTKLNRIRIERLSALLPAKKQSFLEILPFLFQVNSDLLPGYHGPDTPAGIVDYQPSDQSIAAAKRLHAAFQYQRHALHHYTILGVYLINQQDFFRYHSETHFELWVVYSEPLEKKARQLLEKKLNSVSQWVKKTFDIYCHPVLFERQDLISGKLSDLDRDRFYHSGLVLAGSHPQWWSLTQNEHEPTLPLQKKFTHATVDFGQLSAPTPAAAATLAIDAINKVMTQGLEACLDLVYTHTVLQYFSAYEWISEQIKQRLAAGTSKPRFLDADNLKLHFIEQQSQDKQAILFAQQSLYILCNEPLSKPVTQVALPWRREFIKDCVYQWDWPDKNTRLMQLDQRYQSRYRDNFAEYQFVRDYIDATLSTLKHFARQHKLDLVTLLFELEQKFRYLFRPALDQIPCLPPAFQPRQCEQYLYLSRTDEQSDWLISDQELVTPASALYQHPSLLNVLAWAVQNQLLDDSTHLKLADKAAQITMSQLLDLVNFMLRTALTTKKVCCDLFSFPALTECKSLLLFTNLAHQPVSTLSQKGLEISSLQSDPLNYANHYQNLVTRVEGLMCSAAGQWFYFIHRDNTATVQSLITVFNWEKLNPSVADPSCWCPPGNHSAKICKRLQTLFNEVITHHHNNPDSGNVILQLGGRFFKLQWQQGQYDFISFPRQTTLLDCLCSNRHDFSATHIDSETDKKQQFSTLLHYQQKDSFSLFILAKKKTTLLYIIDETGNVFEQSFENIRKSTLVTHYYTFLNNLDCLSSPLPVHLYRIREGHNGWQITPQKLNTTTLNQHYLPVIVELDSLKETSHCTIHCGKSVFSGLRSDEALFHQVTQFVLQLRKSRISYPLYITRLVIKEASQLTAKDYIVHKRHLETMLNP